MPTFTSRKPPPQVVLEIRLRGSGLSIHVLHFRLSLAPRIFTIFDPVRGRASISQIRAPQQLRMPRIQGQFFQERAVPQPINFVPGNSYRIASHTRMCTGHSAARGFIQTRSPSPSQSVSKDAGPHCLSAFGTSVGPASHAALLVLAETLSSSTCLPS